MRTFVYNANPGRVIFGPGSISSLPAEIERLGCRKLLVLATVAQEASARAVADQLGGRSAGLFAGAVMHTPVAVTEIAMARIAESGADGVVSFGGGSTIGLGKAIALRTDLPQIVLPTTYAGSEMTPILGETRDGAKTTLTNASVLPEVVIYDVDLTMTLPRGLSGTSGINAIAHAVEALYARDRNPIVSLMAIEGISALVQALPGIAADPLDRDSRTDALYGAWLCGSCLGSVGMALHHKLCHTLGGSFGLPHAETHTVVLPHALAYNAPAIPDVIDRLRIVLGEDPAGALFDLAGAVGAPRSLRELGMAADLVDEAVGRAVANPYWNPRSVEAGPIRNLLMRAWNGDRPETREA